MILLGPMSPTLLVLAAGMGSRYGGLKQIDPVGPTGEIVLDFAVYDAIRRGELPAMRLCNRLRVEPMRPTKVEKSSADICNCSGAVGSP